MTETKEDMLDMVFDPSITISTPTTPEYRNDEDVELLNTQVSKIKNIRDCIFLFIYKPILI